MTTMAKAIRVKDTAFGQDMLEVLAERQLERIGYLLCRGERRRCTNREGSHT